MTLAVNDTIDVKLQLAWCCKMQTAKRLPAVSRQRYTQCVILIVCSVHAAYALKTASGFCCRRDRHEFVTCSMTATHAPADLIELKACHA